MNAKREHLRSWFPARCSACIYENYDASTGKTVSCDLLVDERGKPCRRMFEAAVALNRFPAGCPHHRENRRHHGAIQ